LSELDQLASPVYLLNQAKCDFSTAVEGRGIVPIDGLTDLEGPGKRLLVMEMGACISLGTCQEVSVPGLGSIG
jgi:hypothetical protein